MSSERFLETNGIRLCAQTFGRPTDEALLLVAGAASSMDAWADDFCRQLADGGRFVIRYDHRDTGRSTSWPPGRPGYRSEDLVNDARAVLDGLGVERAHWVGISMGGWIALQVALEHARRVRTLTLMSTTSATGGSAEGKDLPGMTPPLRAFFDQPPPPPGPQDPETIERQWIATLRAFSGALGVDEADARRMLARTLERTPDIRSADNHWKLEGDTLPLRPRLHEIALPTLVIHGTDDPLFPLPHGEALAREIPGAELLRVQGMGHEMPPRPVWNRVVPAILAHTAARPEEDSP
jgi:pimeloyl-ACP methyl ester carboxylesterase